MGKAVFLHTEEDWLRYRMRGIGGSEAAAVLGVSKWMSAFQLWAHKTKRVTLPPPGGPYIEWGNILEPVVREHYQRHTHRKVWVDPDYTIYEDDEYPFILASLDGWVEDPVYGVGVLEIKTASAFVAREWDDEPPLPYLIQGQHYLRVTGASFVTFAVLIGGNGFKTFDIQRDDDFIASMVSKEKIFWENVESDIQPVVDGHSSTVSVLGKLYEPELEKEIDLPTEALAWDEQRQGFSDRITRLQGEVKGLKEGKAQVENHIRLALGDATLGVLPGGSAAYSWVNQKRGRGESRVLQRRKLNREDD
jgi:putative phage-type endonuclease